VPESVRGAHPRPAGSNWPRWRPMARRGYAPPYSGAGLGPQGWIYSPMAAVPSPPSWPISLQWKCVGCCPMPARRGRNKRHSSAYQPRALRQPSQRYAPFASLASSTTRQGCRRPYVRPCGANQRPMGFNPAPAGRRSGCGHCPWPTAGHDRPGAAGHQNCGLQGQGMTGHR